METNVHVLDQQEAARRVEVDWAEAEWFQVWLRLARRDYHGRPDADESHQNDASIAA